MDAEKIDQLKDQARQDQSQAAPFMEPAPKKGRGRPKKSDKSEPKASKAEAPPQSKPIDIPTKKMVYPLVNLISGAAISYTQVKEAGMTPEELDGASEALGALIDKWAPDALNKWGPEIVTAMIFGQYGLRVLTIKKLVDRQKTAQPAPPPENSEPFHKDNIVPINQETIN